MKRKFLHLFRGHAREAQSLESVLPRQRRDDDIFLVSYPKSGNTWISFIIANIIIERLALDVEVNNFNIHGFIPDIHMGQNIPLDAGFFPFKRIIKSHSDFRHEYLNVLYLLRDPRSVMVSYYKYLTGLGLFHGDIGTLIKHRDFGIACWTKHVNGWFTRVRPATQFRFFKYEDFINDPESNTFFLARLLGVNLSKQQLKNVIQKSTFHKMRELEEQTGSLSLKLVNEDFKFVREGKTNGWRNELTKSDIAFIKEVAGALMMQFGYDQS